MTVEEFARDLAIRLREDAIKIGEKVKSGKSDGMNALIDAAIMSTLISVSEAVLDVSIEKIGGFKR
jgi:hypothetical protein